MKIRYITADLDLVSKTDLSPIIEEIGDKKYCAHCNERINDEYRISLGGAPVCEVPEITIVDFCKLIEGLSDESMRLWNGCNKRVIDMAFESGKEPRSITYNLQEELITRLSKLGLSIAITVYPIGAYSYNEESPET